MSSLVLVCGNRYIDVFVSSGSVPRPLLFQASKLMLDLRDGVVNRRNHSARLGRGYAVIGMLCRNLNFNRRLSQLFQVYRDLNRIDTVVKSTKLLCFLDNQHLIDPFRVDVSRGVVRNGSTGEILSLASYYGYLNRLGLGGDGQALADWADSEGISGLEVLMVYDEDLDVTGSDLAFAASTFDRSPRLTAGLCNALRNLNELMRTNGLLPWKFTTHSQRFCETICNQPARLPPQPCRPKNF